ncbi:hypothetical protein [Tabrizicola sp.]|uniref:hypothetical protein n=1 Tax=Tabrizicola sp. TaxID=2005166 RepID=UPI001A4084EC|nr:hypothetical protein [Tabrizicola sp.]MBL9062829.1 hypothetical protein [Tabrizicola sp.]
MSEDQRFGDDPADAFGQRLGVAVLRVELVDDRERRAVWPEQYVVGLELALEGLGRVSLAALTGV